MKEVKAYVRCQKVEAVIEALEEAGIDGVTLIDVLGIGSYSDPKTKKLVRVRGEVLRPRQTGADMQRYTRSSDC